MRTIAALAAALGLSATAAAAAPDLDLVAPQPVVQDPPTDVSEAVVAPPPKPDDPVICRRELPTGSRIAVKVCQKKSQWVARSSRSSRSGELKHVDGFDDKLAPLPPSNE